MHEPAVSDRREQERKSKIEAQDARSQVALRDRDRMPRPKRDVVKYPAIFPERYLAFGSTIKVVEHRFRHPLAGDEPEVLDANHLWRCYGPGSSCHLHSQYLES
jgi:hypothetical protein